MDIPELLIISGYPTLIDDIRSVCDQLHITPRLMEWERADQKLVHVLQDCFAVEGNPDVIISRGAVADVVERAFADSVVLRAEPDDVDHLEALAEAGALGGKVGFLLYGPKAEAFKTESVRRILGLEKLHLYPVNSKADIECSIRQGQDAGMDVMVGGGRLGKRTGEALGMPVIFAETSRRSIRTAVEQALAIIEARRGEKQRLRSLKTVVASVQEGIMTLRGQHITLLNGVLATMLCLPEDSYPACPDGEKIPLPLFSQLDPVLRRFLQTDALMESVLTIRDQTLFCRKVPLSDGCDAEGSDNSDVMLICRKVTEIQQQERKIRKELHARGFVARFTFADIIGQSAILRDTVEKARIFAATDANILIHGESGTGKELFAQSLHNASSRRNRPFVAVNCAAIPETLLESELFGYVEGAFSGATRHGKIGLFELAHEGTIFLDEIDSLPLGLQGALLRVIQERQVRRVGSQSLTTIDTRILAATNQPLDRLGLVVRADLFYRLNTLNLRVPPLVTRERDALLLARQFLQHYATRYTIAVPRLTAEDNAFIQAHTWPGNVRELENVIHRHVVLCISGHPRALRESLDSLPSPCLQSSTAESVPKLLPDADNTLASLEYNALLRVLEDVQWNRQRAAERLGISRSTLWRKLRANAGKTRTF